MKKLLVFSLTLVIMGFSNCSTSSGNKDSKAGDPVIQLSKAGFIEKVFDFEKNKQWNYIGQKPCIIDFYANWCKPCKMIAPFLEELANTYAGKIIIYKVNIDEEKDLAAVFNIQSIPAVLFCPLHEAPQMSLGALSKVEYDKMIHDILKIQ